jgi:hypothetical protein
VDKDPLIGQKVGAYVVRSFLGESATTRVYAGDWRGGSRRVALKMLRSEIVHDRAQISRLFQIAGTVNSMNHGGGVGEIFDFVEEGDRVYLAMEYLNGQTLAVRLERPPPISVAEGSAVLRGILQVLATIHDHGGIHGNLRPSNVFLLDPPLPNLLKLLDPTSGVGPDVDLSAAGVLGVAMITGQPPPQPAKGIRPSTMREGISARLDDCLVALLDPGTSKITARAALALLS